MENFGCFFFIGIAMFFSVLAVIGSVLPFFYFGLARRVTRLEQELASQQALIAALLAR